jgi:hypothetical protein
VQSFLLQKPTCVRRKRKAAGLPVEVEPLAPEAPEMDKDANSNEDEDTDDPKGDTKCMVCCVSLVVLISQRLQIVETRQTRQRPRWW